jgi:hypothetical protein
MLDGTKTNHENLMNSRLLSRDLNRMPCEYISDPLLLGLTLSVLIHYDDDTLWYSNSLKCMAFLPPCRVPSYTQVLTSLRFYGRLMVVIRHFLKPWWELYGYHDVLEVTSRSKFESRDVEERVQPYLPL